MIARKPSVRAQAASQGVLAKACLETLESRMMLSAAHHSHRQAVVGVTTVEIHPATARHDGTTVVPSTALTPAEIRAAYGVNSISMPNVTTDEGAGQTIAIVDAYNDPNAASDLNTFDAQFGLQAPPSFKVLNENGGTTLPGDDPEKKPDTWELEESLDIEWAHAIAPQANIILFEANSTSLTDLFQAVKTAKGTAGVSVVSMSWSTSGDQSGETSYDSTFTSNSGQGVTFLAATGDSGGQAGYPAVSPNVIGVGGTTLDTNSSGAYLGESAWSDSSGGLSSGESQPSYQKGVVTQSSTQRGAPDVSMDANPNTGVAVYDSYDGSGTGGNWFQVGGTSLATPMWAGLISIVNQGRVANGLSTYDGATGTLPRLYSLPSSDFHDITTGSNSRYSAGPGYDLVTGLGTPIANKLVPDLANISGNKQPPPPPPPPPPPTYTPPVIASLTATPNPAIVMQDFTVTANGVTDSNGTVTSVSYYYETNRGDVLLGTLTNGTHGWSMSMVANAPGTYTILAQAENNDGQFSNVAVVNVTVEPPAGYYYYTTRQSSGYASTSMATSTFNFFGMEYYTYSSVLGNNSQQENF